MTKYRFTRPMRLRHQLDFDRVHQSNVYAADDVLVVRGSRNEQQLTRLGISISRKVGNAIVRNRWKRLVREAYRLSRENLPGSLDLVVRPRRGAIPDFAAIQRSLQSLCHRIARRLPKGDA